MIPGRVAYELLLKGILLDLNSWRCGLDFDGRGTTLPGVVANGRVSGLAEVLEDRRCGIP